MAIKRASLSQIRWFYDHLGWLQDTFSGLESLSFDLLKKYGHFEVARQIFEIGPGQATLATQLFEELLPGHARYVAYDLSPRMVSRARRRLSRWADRAQVHVSQGFFDFPIQPGSFDRFIATYVLDLLPPNLQDDLLAFAHKVLDDNGLVCLASMAAARTCLERCVIGLWQAMATISPVLTGGCTPVSLLELLGRDRWEIRFWARISLLGFPTEVLVARKLNG